jgi:hypothetical protein
VNVGIRHDTIWLASRLPSLCYCYTRHSAKSSSVFRKVRLIIFVLCGMRHFFNHVMYFIIVFVFVFIKKNLLPSSSEVRNECCSTSTIPRDLHVMCKGHFTFIICFKISFHACCAFGGYLLLVLPVQFRFLEPTMQLTVDINFTLRGGLSFPDNDGR